MPLRYFLSNISKHWPIERQEKLLDEMVPEWRKSDAVYRDMPSAAKRKAHAPDALKERDVMLRRVSSPRPETIVVASLPVLAFGAVDLNGVLAKAEKRGATIRALYPKDRHIPPDATKEEVHAAVEELNNSKHRPYGGRLAVEGRAASLIARKADIEARIAIIEPYWHLMEPTTKELGIMAGKVRKGHRHVTPMAHATMVLHLGDREEAQNMHKGRVEGAEKRAARKLELAEKRAAKLRRATERETRKLKGEPVNDDR